MDMIYSRFLFLWMPPRAASTLGRVLFTLSLSLSLSLFLSTSINRWVSLLLSCLFPVFIGRARSVGEAAVLNRRILKRKKETNTKNNNGASRFLLLPNFIVCPFCYRLLDPIKLHSTRTIRFLCLFFFFWGGGGSSLVFIDKKKQPFKPSEPNRVA